jgi:hypothetical protein
MRNQEFVICLKLAMLAKGQALPDAINFRKATSGCEFNRPMQHTDYNWRKVCC